MNKLFILPMLAVLVIMALGVVSACDECSNEATYVSGIIYQQGGNPNDNPISGASVTVTCNNFTSSDTSTSEGHYSVSFTGNQCDYGDAVTVKATKDSLNGEEKGSIEYSYNLGCRCGCTINLGIVDVPLVPEFGLIAGSVAVIGALGLFFFVRKK